MGVTLNPGTGGEVVETVNRNGSTDERQVVELGYVPTFWALTAPLTATANRIQFLLFNNSATAIVQIRAVVLCYSSITGVSGVLTGAWTQRLRVSPTTDPTGTGTLSIFSFDHNDSLPASITAFSNPGTVPSGGTIKDLTLFVPQADEVKATTLDAPTMFSSYDFGGTTIYSSWALGSNAKPITLRQDQSYEVVQSATTGAMAGWQIFCAFTVI